MSSLLEVKTKGMDWGKIIFPTDALPLDHLDNDQAANVIRLICQEISSFGNYDVFMPHEVASVVIGALDEDEFNDYEFSIVKDLMYETVIALADVLFKAVKQGANYTLKHSDESHTIIAYQLHATELF